MLLFVVRVTSRLVWRLLKHICGPIKGSDIGHVGTRQLDWFVFCLFMLLDTDTSIGLRLALRLPVEVMAVA